MTNCFMAAVLALDGLTKKHFGHYAILKLFPSDHQVQIVPLEDIFSFACIYCSLLSSSIHSLDEL